MLTYEITAERRGAGAAVARCKAAEIALDTNPVGTPDAFNPAELLLAALAACMLKGIERAAPLLEFQLDGTSVEVRGVRQDRPPKMARIEYDLVVVTGESDRRLELLHQNVRKFGTIYNTLAETIEVVGRIRRAGSGVPGNGVDPVRTDGDGLYRHNESSVRSTP